MRKKKTKLKQQCSVVVMQPKNGMYLYVLTKTTVIIINGREVGTVCSKPK